ncbi:MAG: hypothetical protein ACLS6Q_04025 [Christensenellaceae bacterium]
MKNRIIALIVLLAVVFALSSCVNPIPEHSSMINSSTPIEKSVENFEHIRASI